MLVVPFVTRGTGIGGRLESLSLVTAVTLHLAVPSLQPKCGTVVVETNRLPRGLHMAAVACRSNATLVRVLAAMAIVAVGRGVPVTLAGRVTFVARHLCMPAAQDAAIR
jgi:hypothetical protein